ncbi:MAG TPA: LCP family protein [Acidimicrobiales bacterium]|nr:LCP family protein [Acidimicrobiales bacterium]
MSAVDDTPSAAAGRLRRWPRRILLACNVLVAVLILGAGTVAGYAYYELDQIGRVAVKDLTPAGHGGQSRAAAHVPAFTVLIIGSDTRRLKKSTGLDIGNSQTNGEALSDSIILARVAPSTHQLALLSIPRDLFVHVPGLGEEKISAAFSGGHPSRLIHVVQTQLGIDVNHFVEVNFDTFEQVADDIGGVEQYFRTPARDFNSGLRISHPGCVLLKGAQALAFVRSRDYQYELGGEWYYQEEPESDLGRIQRQQAFIKDAIHKAQTNGDLSNLGVLTGIVNSVTSNLTVDSAFSDGELLRLAEDFAHIDAGRIPNYTYPTQNIPVPAGEYSPGLEKVPAEDKVVVDRFLAIGAGHKPAHTPATAGATSTSTSTSTSTTTLPPDGSPYASAAKVIPSSSSTYKGVYIPPGRVPGQKVSTCGN